MYNHEDGFTELNTKKPSGMFTISHEISTGLEIDIGVNKIMMNSTIDAISEFTIRILKVD